MSILDHIAELRDRLIKCCVALTVTTLVAAFVLYDRTFSYITRSYCEIDPKYRIATAAGRGCGLLAQSPLEGIGIRIRLSLLLGLVMALPVIAFQLWRFITPGLKPNEKRFAIPFSLATTLLFASGVEVAFYTMPKAIGWLAAAGGPSLIQFYAADRYLRFVLFMGAGVRADVRVPPRAGVPVAGGGAVVARDAAGLEAGDRDHHRCRRRGHAQPGPDQPVRHGDPDVGLLLCRGCGGEVRHRACTPAAAGGAPAERVPAAGALTARIQMLGRVASS